MPFFENLFNTLGDTVEYLVKGEGPEERHERNEQVKSQMEAYKEQTQLTRDEINRKRGEEKAEKRRVEEKQIRNLRRNYSTRGLLNYQNQQASSGAAPAQADVSNKLGT